MEKQIEIKFWGTTPKFKYIPKNKKIVIAYENYYDKNGRFSTAVFQNGERVYTAEGYKFRKKIIKKEIVLSSYTNEYGVNGKDWYTTEYINKTYENVPVLKITWKYEYFSKNGLELVDYDGITKKEHTIIKHPAFGSYTLEKARKALAELGEYLT